MVIVWASGVTGRVADGGMVGEGWERSGEWNPDAEEVGRIGSCIGWEDTGLVLAFSEGLGLVADL